MGRNSGMISFCSEHSQVHHLMDASRLNWDSYRRRQGTSVRRRKTATAPTVSETAALFKQSGWPQIMVSGCAVRRGGDGARRDSAQGRRIWRERKVCVPPGTIGRRSEERDAQRGGGGSAPCLGF